MSASVQEVLDSRLRQRLRKELGRSFSIALGLHLGATFLLVVIPMLTAAPRKPLRYVAVQVVPAGALGVPHARPASPRPATSVATPPPPAPVAAKPIETRKPVAAAPPPADDRRPSAEASSARARPTAVAAAPPEPAVGSPTGVVGGLSVGASVAGVDNPSFTYGYYLDQMLAQIQREWVRPPLGSGIEALVAFRIQRDGRVTDLRIERSSGYSSFDLAGMRAVQAASPLPPLPRGFTHPSLGVNLIFK